MGRGKGMVKDFGWCVGKWPRREKAERAKSEDAEAGK